MGDRENRILFEIESIDSVEQSLFDTVESTVDGLLFRKFSWFIQILQSLSVLNASESQTESISQTIHLFLG